MSAPIRFDLILPGRIVFGWGQRNSIGTLAKSLGNRAFVIDGSRKLRESSEWTDVVVGLKSAGVSAEFISTATQEPTIEDVDTAAAIVRRLQPRQGDFVLGIGGGSAMDLAKAVAVMATYGDGESVRDFLEGIGTGRTLDRSPLPLMLVPTTSGTGSEATKNAVISCTEPPCKKSLRSDRLMASIVLVDPQLTVTMGPEQTAFSGMDAITQLIESYTSNRAQPVTDAWCDMGLKLALGSLVKAVYSPNDQRAREEMASAALLSGMALANSGLGMAHGVAAALGAICDVPHGLACAVMLPITLKTNREQIASKLEALTIIWKVLKKESNVAAVKPAVDLLIETVEQICMALKIPSRLRDLGVQKDQIPLLVAGSRGNSMNGNPRHLSDSELTEILEAHW
ncbi:iron-containing alcohol dehydrogenase [Planctomicrobium sp. SH668]|uniref:iron-containing alcohol dehydrogenase n=1 Tax=Planctomicrobium sp. SH668 TaxID=3448126 RepID=UPI003F5AF223